MNTHTYIYMYINIRYIIYIYICYIYIYLYEALKTLPSRDDDSVDLLPGSALFLLEIKISEAEKGGSNEKSWETLGDFVGFYGVL